MLDERRRIEAKGFVSQLSRETARLHWVSTPSEREPTHVHIVVDGGRVSLSRSFLASVTLVPHARATSPTGPPLGHPDLDRHPCSLYGATLVQSRLQSRRWLKPQRWRPPIQHSVGDVVDLSFARSFRCEEVWRALLHGVLAKSLPTPAAPLKPDCLAN